VKIKHAAIIVTVLVIAAGIALISPLYLLRAGSAESKPKIMLTFNAGPDANATEWCAALAALLNSQEIEASVFFVGQVAEQYPQCLAALSDKIDIGSQTYSGTRLTGITDYSMKLSEVQLGKTAVDSAGRLTSRIFRAPFNATDDDIYSLLSRSGIWADFSYTGQYNVYQNGQFIKYPADVLAGRDYTPDDLLKLPKSARPLIVYFDNTDPISNIETFLRDLKRGDYDFVNASTLAGYMLTERE
jgi:peptidoglycan/xylan/chitin deacetylase (PgdA/CDA1 family)